MKKLLINLLVPTLLLGGAWFQLDPVPPPTGPGLRHPIPTPSAFPPITVLAMGDSLTVGHGPNGSITESYRSKLSRLMNLAGQPHTWKVAAVGGTKCSYWAGKIDEMITLHQPHLIFLNCGTNDTPTDNTEADYRYILTRAKARGVQIVAALIGMPDMQSPTNKVRPYIIDWMDGTNTKIRAALSGHPDVPYAAMYRVPPNLEWYQTDGIHLLRRAEEAYAELFYLAAREMRGWKTLEQIGTYEMCGLSGHDRDEPRPIPDVDYRMCRQ